MGDTTGITWTDSTFNPWWGCARVSPGCEHCYAEAFAFRTGHKVWGAKADRRTLSETNWKGPRLWNAAAAKAKRRHRVFCASMADVFDTNAPDGARDRLWALIRETPWLDWQLLTKRPQNVLAMLPPDWGEGYPNVWLGVTAENQEWADRRLAILKTIPARTKFVSYEPALEPVDFSRWLISDNSKQIEHGEYPLGVRVREIDWVIIGGESGPKARPFDPAWGLAVIDQCRAAGTACFFKQMGEPWARAHKAHQRHGADPAEWPAEFLVQEFPNVATTHPDAPAPARGQVSLPVVG